MNGRMEMASLGGTTYLEEPREREKATLEGAGTPQAVSGRFGHLR